MIPKTRIPSERYRAKEERRIIFDPSTSIPPTSTGGSRSRRIKLENEVEERFSLVLSVRLEKPNAKKDTTARSDHE